MTPPHQPTLAELQTAADQATAAVTDARRRLEQARLNVFTAADAHYQAVIALTAPAPATPTKAKAAAAAAESPVDAAAAQLDKAIAAYEQVRRDLGLG